MELMMKVDIDFSVFTSPSDAYGNVTGSLELCALPVVGDRVSFLFARDSSLPGSSFDGFLVVTDRRLDAEQGTCTIGLEELVATSASEAEILMKYFETGFGLLAYRY